MRLLSESSFSLGVRGLGAMLDLSSGMVGGPTVLASKLDSGTLARLDILDFAWAGGSMELL